MLRRAWVLTSRGSLAKRESIYAVVIGHSGDTTDLGYLEELVGNGSYIGMDRFGIDTILSSKTAVKTVAAMCLLGCGKDGPLADAACYNHWLPDALPIILPRDGITAYS